MIKSGPLVTFANKYHGTAEFERDLWRPSSSTSAQIWVGWSPLRLLMPPRREIPCASAHRKEALLTFKWNFKWISIECYGSQYSEYSQYKKCLRPLVCCLNSGKHVAMSFALNSLSFLINGSLTEGGLFKHLSRYLSPFLGT